jgi:hypothetical protein
MRTTHALLLAGLTALLFLAPLPAAAQTPSPGSVAPATETRTPAVVKPGARPEPYLDRKFGSAFDRFSRWKARMKKEHFTQYLAAYSALLAGVTGVVFGLVSYRLGDPMSTYRTIKRRTLQLAFAIGGALGVSAAVLQVPPNTIGKISLLFLAVGIGAATATIASWFAFFVLRLRSNRLARRDGRRVTDRMRHT